MDSVDIQTLLLILSDIDDTLNFLIVVLGVGFLGVMTQVRPPRR